MQPIPFLELIWCTIVIKVTQFVYTHLDAGLQVDVIYNDFQKYIIQIGKDAQFSFQKGNGHAWVSDERVVILKHFKRLADLTWSYKPTLYILKIGPVSETQCFWEEQGLTKYISYFFVPVITEKLMN